MYPERFIFNLLPLQPRLRRVIPPLGTAAVVPMGQRSTKQAISDYGCQSFGSPSPFFVICPTLHFHLQFTTLISSLPLSMDIPITDPNNSHVHDTIRKKLDSSLSFSLAIRNLSFLISRSPLHNSDSPTELNQLRSSPSVLYRLFFCHTDTFHIQQV